VSWDRVMNPRSSALPLLGDLEQAALAHLWRHPDSEVQQVHVAIGARRGISINTVGSALERLHKKGLATREKVSHAYRYSAAIDEANYRARRVVDAAGGVAVLGEKGVLAAFVDLVESADEDALSELARLINNKKAARCKDGAS
jgi:predicted transcriptional regulator